MRHRRPGPAEVGNPAPKNLWWVCFDRPAEGIFTEGTGEHCAVAAVHVGMRLAARPRETDREDVTWWDLGGMEHLVADEGHMRALMRAVRRSGLHGHYRKAGEKTEFRF